MKNSAIKTTGSRLSGFLGIQDEIMSIAICDKHGEYEEKSREVMGKVFKTRCPKCSLDRDAERKQYEFKAAAVNRDEKIKRLIGEAGIPKRFALRRFDNYHAEIKEQSQALDIARYFAENFEMFMSTGASLIFCGKPGTGKTHLAAAIANAVCEQGRSAVFMSVLKATRKIKDTWRKNSEVSENQIYRGMVHPDLLILDEVGMQFGSESEKLILFEILNGRYENVKPTIVISNLLPTEISEFLGERVVDRLQEGGGSTVVFGWDSYRPNVLNDDDLPRAYVNPVDWNNRDES
jgi:DNA replication protein DnaC